MGNKLLKTQKINIKKFGIINEACIDISPLTVFIGPNSSGKSFIAKLIHCFNKRNNNITEPMLISEAINCFDEEDKKLFEEITHQINTYNKSNKTINSKPFKLKLKKFEQILRGGIYKYCCNLLEEEIKEQFDENLEELINFNETEFRIEIDSNELIKPYNDHLFFNSVEIPIKHDILKNNHLFKFSTDDENILINIESDLINEINRGNTEFILMSLYGIISSSVIQNTFFENSYYIPAERSEITMDKKLLTRKVIGNSDVSRNQAEVLINLLNIKTTEKSDFYELGCEFEKEFSGISVDIKNEGRFNEIVYKDMKSNSEISSKLLSTSIHEMSIFSLYLKYILKKGDLLIIEEPEAHLHPKNQRILVKYFIRAINQGLKVMITTHSDYILNQINNFITLNNIRGNALSDLGYEQRDLLNYKSANIYNFKMNEHQTFDAEKLEINKYGFIEDNFSEVSTELYDETITIDNLSIR